MLQIPSTLERRLKKLFSRAKDREKFVREVVEQAIDQLEENEQPEYTVHAVGGTLHLFTDGGSRGNPGDAAIGCVIKNPETGEVLKEYKETIGTHTNNVAEYRALIAGLDLASRFHPNRLVCHMDSELIVKQLSGEYRVKMPTLQPLVQEAQELAAQFPEVAYHHVARAQNSHADRLVNEALDGIS